MDVYLARKRFILPGDLDDDDDKIIDEVKVFATMDAAIKQFREYRNELMDEVAEGDLLDSLKDDYVLYALTYSGKSLKAWVQKLDVIE